VLAGGKRPRTTLTPTLVLKDGKPFLAISTPGGDSQDQQILNVLLQMFVFGRPIQEALEAPRVNSLHPFSSFDSHESEAGVLEIEPRRRSGQKRSDRARTQAARARSVRHEHARGRGRRESGHEDAARRRGSAARTLHPRLVTAGKV